MTSKPCLLIVTSDVSALQSMTIFDIAKHLKTSLGMIKDILKRNLPKRFSKPSLKGIGKIAIDEISIGKGHKYLTVVLNLSTGAVIFLGEGKGVIFRAFLSKNKTF